MGSRSCGKSFEEWSPRLRTNVHTNLYSFHTHTSGYFFFFFIYSKIITGLYLLGKNTERAEKCIQLNKIKDSWPQPLRLQLHFHVKGGFWNRISRESIQLFYKTTWCKTTSISTLQKDGQKYEHLMTIRFLEPTYIIILALQVRTKASRWKYLGIYLCTHQ